LLEGLWQCRSVGKLAAGRGRLPEMGLWLHDLLLPTLFIKCFPLGLALYNIVILHRVVKLGLSKTRAVLRSAQNSPHAGLVLPLTFDSEQLKYANCGASRTSIIG